MTERSCRSRSSLAAAAGLCGVVVLALLGGPARAATIGLGELEFASENEPRMQGLHGYTEYRIFVRNRSAENTYRVTLSLPAHTYNMGGQGTIQGIHRTVEVGPGLIVPVSLLQPAAPDVAGKDVAIRINGRLQEQTLPLSPVSSRGGHGSYGYARYGRRAKYYGSVPPGANEPLLLVSLRIPETFFQRTVKIPAGGPPGGAAFGGMGGGPGRMGMPGGPVGPGMPAPAAGPAIVNTINAQRARADAPVSAWSRRWLAYTRYDGVVLTAEDLEELKRGSNDTRAVLQALWQYVETGGVLLVLGPGEVDVPAVWKTQPWSKHGLTSYSVGFGQCIFSPDRTPELWDANYQVTDAVLATLRTHRTPAPVIKKVAELKKDGPVSQDKFQEKLAQLLVGHGEEEFQQHVLSLARNEDRWGVLTTALSQTSMPWVGGGNQGLTDLNARFPVVDDLGVPVRGLFALMILFAVALGPVNLVVLARKKKRIWMLWTVPAISMATCVAVFGYMIVGEGWQGHARVAGVTFLDETQRRATSLGRAAFYSPLTPGDGLWFSEETEVHILAGQGNACQIDWTQGQHLAHGWVTARIPAHFKLRKSEPRRERLNVRRTDAGALEATNALGADVVSLWLTDDKGLLYQTGRLPAGERVAVQRAGTRKATQRPTAGWRALYTQGDWGKTDPAPRPEDVLGPRMYLAVVEGSPFLEQGLKGATVRPDQSVVVGFMAP